MAKPTPPEGFLGNSAGQGRAHVLGDGMEPGTPPVEVSDLPETKPVIPDTGAEFNPATGLPIIPLENISEHAAFNEDFEFPGDLPDILDFF